MTIDYLYAIAFFENTFPRGSKLLIKTALGTLTVFFGSAIWLFIAWSNGNRTNQWKKVPAVVIKNDVQESADDRHQPLGWKTTVTYTVAGKDYSAIVDEYLVGGNQVVYVDPNDPTSVVGKPGPTIQAMARPLIATAGSGLFAIVLILIAVSPKEED